MIKLKLYSERDHEVQSQSGLNWGHSNGNVTPVDACIALPTKFFQVNPGFFPPQGSIINVEWDDGEKMQCLLEGTQVINNQVYPKQISTYGDKSKLGVYLRGRLGVSPTHKITRIDLKNYGREDVDVTSLGGGNYIFDFK